MQQKKAYYSPHFVNYNLISGPQLQITNNSHDFIYNTFGIYQEKSYQEFII